MPKQALWDIFCHVIDNHGDLGVSWRLARQLAHAGHAVRLWIHDASALEWMAPKTADASWPGIQIRPWALASDTDTLDHLPPADIWIEAFGCTLPDTFLAHAVATRRAPPRWINLEYLSAESWVPRMHGLPSPVMSGPAKGWTKTFFYPGFTADTGGLLRETNLMARQQAFDRAGWRQRHAPALSPNGLLISLFCYEPAALAQLLTQLVDSPHHLLVTPGRPLAAVRQALRHMAQAPSWSALPYTDQDRFDEMLWACDLNLVRGEDSLVRALWAGQAFIWQIYPQDDNAHHGKLQAFLDWQASPQSLQTAHHVWNGTAPGTLPTVTPETLKIWRSKTVRDRQHLLQPPDLLTQLLASALGNTEPPAIH